MDFENRFSFGIWKIHQYQQYIDEPYLETDTTTKTVKIKDCLTSNQNRKVCDYNWLTFICLDQKLKHESLILAQDERWRRA